MTRNHRNENVPFNAKQTYAQKARAEYRPRTLRNMRQSVDNWAWSASQGIRAGFGWIMFAILVVAGIGSIVLAIHFIVQNLYRLIG